MGASHLVKMKRTMTDELPTRQINARNSHNTADDFSSLIEKKQETETESARHSRFTCPTDYSAGSTNPEDHDTKVYRPACLNWPTRDK